MNAKNHEIVKSNKSDKNYENWTDLKSEIALNKNWKSENLKTYLSKNHEFLKIKSFKFCQIKTKLFYMLA